MATMQQTFIIGGKEYSYALTYMAKRFFHEVFQSKEKEEIEKMKSYEHEDVYLNMALLCLKDKPFQNIDELKNALLWDEYQAIQKILSDMLDNDIKEAEGKTEIEKKRQTT